MRAVDHKLTSKGITSTMLSSMKGVKMSALTAKLSGLIQGLRIAELAAGNSFRKLMVTSGEFKNTYPKI